MEKVVCRSGGQNGTGPRVIASHKRFRLLQISRSGAPATAAAVAAPIETPVTSGETVILSLSGLGFLGSIFKLAMLFRCYYSMRLRIFSHFCRIAFNPARYFEQRSSC